MMSAHKNIGKRLVFYKTLNKGVRVGDVFFSEDMLNGNPNPLWDHRHPESVLVAAQYFGLDISDPHHRLLLFYTLVWQRALWSSAWEQKVRKTAAPW